MTENWKQELERLRRGPPPPSARASPLQFRIATILVATAVAAAGIVLVRFEFPSFIIALGVLFALLVFAGDIWKWLPR